MRLAFLIFFILYPCFASTTDSIRTQNPNNFSKETWEVNLQQCLNKNTESCRIIISIGLKTLEECKAKSECGLIGEILWYSDSKHEAIEYFEKACLAKDMRGCYFVGLHKTDLQEFVQAMLYFEKACDKKHSPSCFMLANFYENGKGVRQDYEKAAILYRKSCKLEYPDACFTLGNLHKEGRSLAHNLSLAKEFYGKACDIGMQKGCDFYKELNQSGVPSLYKNKNVFN